MKKENKRNKKSALLLIVSLAILSIASLAYFTDRFETGNINIGAGENPPVDIEIVPGETPDPTDPDNPDKDTPWGSVEGSGIAIPNRIMLPTETLQMPNTINNAGTFAVDIRETIMIESLDLALTKGAEEWYIMKDGAALTGGVLSNNNKVLTYTDIKSTLSSTNEVIGTNPTSMDANYVLKFRDTADNEWQTKKIKVTYRVDAKQHTGTTDADWALVEKLTSTVN